ncbi:MAG: coniferyl aldehyde dehydrogenase [Myxococcota bacterium]
MSLAPVDPAAASVPSPEDLRARFEARAAFAARSPIRRCRSAPSASKLIAALQDRRAEIIEAVRADFGHRSPHESLVTEIYMPVSAGKFVLRHLGQWMRREPRRTMLALLPARSSVVPQPLGVVGVMSPWNYPVQLALTPVIYALAAGNRVMLKPSELTPRTGDKMAEILGSLFPDDLVAVVTGGAELGASFSALPFDHVLFTGSTRVGRLVMQAAAKNLVPVTLELGGKSPAIVHDSFDLQRAGDALAGGKLFNAGQTCVAPDYVLVDKARADALCEAIAAGAARLYPRLADNPDYTSVINDAHRARLQHLLDDAKAKGARLVEINPAGEAFDGAGNKMAPVLVRGPTDEMEVMQEEIFGPVLPIVEVDGLEAALRYVNDRPRPLALYYFDDDPGRIDRVLTGTHSGGVTVNECMLHVAEEHLPFGGVGPSGMGAYHGREGFDTFSHRKAVFRQPRINGRRLVSPPYGSRIERLIDWLM